MVLLEMWLMVITLGQIQGPESLLQVPPLLPSHLHYPPQQTKTQQQQERGSAAPEVHVPTKAVRLPEAPRTGLGLEMMERRDKQADLERSLI